MDRKIKYFILFFLLTADLLIHIQFNHDLWNLFYTAFFIVFMFDQLEEVIPVRIRRILAYLMMLFCFIDGSFGLMNNDFQNVYLSFGFLLFMIWLYLKTILIDIARFCLKKEYSYLTLKITNLYIFIYGKEQYILSVKGAALNLSGKYHEALECLKESEELGYNHHYLYANIGYSWMFLKNYEKAYEYFKLAIDGNPLDVDYLYCISYILIQLGNYDESKYHIEKALKLDETHESINELKEFLESEAKT